MTGTAGYHYWNPESIYREIVQSWSCLKNCVTQKIVPLDPHLKNHGGAVLFSHSHSDCSTILRQQFFCCWLYATVLFSHWVLLCIQTANCSWIQFKGKGQQCIFFVGCMPLLKICDISKYTSSSSSDETFKRGPRYGCFSSLVSSLCYILPIHSASSTSIQFRSIKAAIQFLVLL